MLKAQARGLRCVIIDPFRRFSQGSRVISSRSTFNASLQLQRSSAFFLVGAGAQCHAADQQMIRDGTLQNNPSRVQCASLSFEPVSRPMSDVDRRGRLTSCRLLCAQIDSSTHQYRKLTTCDQMYSLEQQSESIKIAGQDGAWSRSGAFGGASRARLPRRCHSPDCTGSRSAQRSLTRATGCMPTAGL